MSQKSPENFDGYGKRCLAIFAVVMCLTGIMVGIHFSHLSQSLAIGLTLMAAVVNAGLVAGSLMHIISEKKVTLISLLFTAIFFAGLMILTIGAHLSVPTGTVQ